MFLEFFIKGAIVSFSIAAPVGPVGILCMRRTLSFGKRSGFVSGLGAATAHIIFASILVSGLALVSDCLIKAHGCKTFLSKPLELNRKVNHKNLIKDFISIFLLTMTNPITILAYLAAFTSFGLADLEGSWINSIFLVFGIFCGATFWWFLLSEAVAKFRNKITQNAMIWINRIAGIIIAGFGAFAWIYLVV